MGNGTVGYDKHIDENISIFDFFKIISYIFITNLLHHPQVLSPWKTYIAKINLNVLSLLLNCKKYMLFVCQPFSFFW